MAGFKKMNQQQDQRQSTMRNLVTSLLWHGRIETTLARAKATRKIAEKLITIAVKEHANTVKVVKEIKEGEKEINAGKEEALKQIKAVSEDLALDVIKKIGISGIKASDIKAAIKDLEN